MKSKCTLFAIIALQSCLIALTFWPYLSTNDTYLFCNLADGIKNYFTYHTYVHDVANPNLFHYRFFSYPFGDSIVYTDNTPILAVAVKLLGKLFPSIVQHDILIYNSTIITNFLTASISLYLIIARFVKSAWLVIPYSVLLPWISQMTFRINGHMNLSYSTIILLSIYLLILLYENTNYTKKYWGLAITFIVFLVFSFFIHGYYLFILAFTAGLFLFFQGLLQQKMRPLIASVLIPAIAFFTCFALLQWLDDDLKKRSNDVIGFGWDEWESELICLLSPYTKSTFRFFLPQHYPSFNYEKFSYLGGAFVIGAIFLLLAKVYQSFTQQFIFNWSTNSKRQLLAILTLTATFLIIISLGEEGLALKTEYQVNNYLNPIFYLHKIIPQFSHIRYTTRFNFPVFFIFNILLLVSITNFQKSKVNYTIKTIFYLSLCTLLGLDTYDTIKRTEKYTNYLSKEYIAANLNFPSLDFTKYQCILPIPYFHVGSESMDKTMETNDPFFDRMLSLSSHSNLPLMSSKMSRTPEYQLDLFINMFTQDTLPETLSKKMTNKSVLLVYSKKYGAKDCKNCNMPEREPARTVFKHGEEFIGKKKVNIVYQDNDYIYYNWSLEKQINN